MSVKYAAQKHTENHYVLPRMKDMRCDVHAFLSGRLYELSEESMWNQAMQTAGFEGVTAVYLMPDCHGTGHAGFPVGAVVVTEDTVLQAGSGYDISCFTGDTKVPLVDGRELTFSELTEQYAGGEVFYVYSMTAGGHVTAGRAHHPRVIKQDAELIEVTLDNEQVITCTPDHEFMLRDGSYARAEMLQAGTSLMPLYRTYDDEYCDVKHPCDDSIERMYRVAFRELNGYVPVWPQVVHHDIFNEANPNQTKLNDDPRYLVEMNENDHFRLHADRARERLNKGEIWGARAHKLYPEMYSKMGSENMKKLHADPEFSKRLRERAPKNAAAGRASGKMVEADKLAGQRGREFLLAYNTSDVARERSRQVGLKNKGRKRSAATRAKMAAAIRGRVYPEIPCSFCRKIVRGTAALKSHVKAHHNNHVVKSIMRISRREDVYCLTVDVYANFALSAGVFVHNCGISCIRVPGLSAQDVKGWDVRERFVRECGRRIAFGIGSDRPEAMPKYSNTKLDEILRHGARALGVPSDNCERQFIPVSDAFEADRVERAAAVASAQLGSTGGGNHFLELQVDEKDGSVWVMVHCGSRGYGFQTADHFFKRGAELRGMPYNQREQSWLKLDEQLGKEYWAHHNAAANYAIANRHVIVESVNEALRKVFKAEGELYYEISHNLIQEETLWLPDGSTKKGFVHRKGATRAFPAGHPSLVKTRWEKTGHPCVVPGSMYAGAAILFPSEGARDKGCSVNHGSGRQLARGEAKRKLKHKQEFIDDQMANVKRRLGDTEIRGIVTNTKKTPLDECGHVYKDLDDVLAVLEAENIARVERRDRKSVV